MPQSKKVTRHASSKKKRWTSDRIRFEKHGPYTCDALKALAKKWKEYDEPMFESGAWPIERFSDEELGKLVKSSINLSLWWHDLFDDRPVETQDVMRLAPSQMQVLQDNGFNLFHTICGVLEDESTSRYVEILAFLLR